MPNRVDFKGNAHPSEIVTTAPRGDAGAVSSADQALTVARVKERARGLRAASHGTFGVVDQFRSLNSPWTAFSNVPVDIVTYVVPALSVLMVTRIAVDFSDPIFNAGSWLGWRAAVDGGRVPGVGQQGADWASGGFGGLWSPMEIPPIYVQANQTFRLQAATLVAGFADFVVVSGRFTGELISTGKVG